MAISTPKLSWLKHRDMRISNIMEHRPEASLILPKGFKSKKKQFKLPGITPAIHIKASVAV